MKWTGSSTMKLVLKIKEKVKNIYPAAFAAIKCIKIKDPLMLDVIMNGHSNPFLMNMQCFGNDNAGKVICYIDTSNAGLGFGAAIRLTLNALYFCDYFGFVPCVHYEKKTFMYNDDSRMETNPFNYFFNDVSDVTKEKCYRSQAVLLYRNNHKYLAESLNEDDKCYHTTDAYINEMAKVAAKYIKMNQATKTFVEEGIRICGVDSNTIAVHIRGTDYKIGYRNHPIFINAKDYFEKIDPLLKNGNYNNIFVATDDSVLLNEFVEKYGNKIVYFKDVHRGDGTLGVHDTGKDGYRVGQEILRDISVLASCGALISGASQVSVMAKIFNKAYYNPYRKVITLFKGVNRQGENYISWQDERRKHQNLSDGENANEK